MEPSSSPRTLPAPDFYDPATACQWSYRPDQQRLFEAAVAHRRAHDIRPSGTDVKKVHLLLIDLQKDFCFPEGSLFVAGHSGRGAIDDSDRIARFIYRNLEAVTDITCTLDTHFPYQIFFASFWLDDAARPLAPHRLITVDDVRSGAVMPNPNIAWWLCEGDYTWLERQVEFYCEELEREGKYTLYLWPPHCILGSDGHVMVGAIHEARLFHAYVRGCRSWVELKGGHALTENYSVLSPEVGIGHDGNPLAERNSAFVSALLGSDAVVIAGQAASHCVKSTIDDLLGCIRDLDEELVHRVYILADCMSAVTVPDRSRPGELLFDFTPQAEQALTAFADAGMHVVRSTDPIASWPDIGL